jgi:hypothetical protein
MSYVRNQLGDPLLCCWDDCGQYGHYEARSVRVQEGRPVTYVFCCPRHQEYWINSVEDNGNLPSGSKRLLPPRGF